MLLLLTLYALNTPELWKHTFQQFKPSNKRKETFTNTFGLTGIASELTQKPFAMDNSLTQLIASLKTTTSLKMLIMEITLHVWKSLWMSIFTLVSSLSTVALVPVHAVSDWEGLSAQSRQYPPMHKQPLLFPSYSQQRKDREEGGPQYWPLQLKRICTYNPGPWIPSLPHRLPCSAGVSRTLLLCNYHLTRMLG